eukprot:TRINITY_DN3311_c0_g1_i1.p1 TRINITY_DN3311_c0_g1~~TRINITY_DN3311_c0_g1_i1.p1  ORF type:complete len:1144 (-),score=322.12 TRINITY_DN3311_c0_g1_i1:83-3514(-)
MKRKDVEIGKYVLAPVSRTNTKDKYRGVVVKLKNNNKLCEVFFDDKDFHKNVPIASLENPSTKKEFKNRKTLDRVINMAKKAEKDESLYKKLRETINEEKMDYEEDSQTEFSEEEEEEEEVENEKMKEEAQKVIKDNYLKKGEKQIPPQKDPMDAVKMEALEDFYNRKCAKGEFPEGLTPSDRYKAHYNAIHKHGNKWEKAWIEAFDEKELSKDEFGISLDPITANPTRTYFFGSDKFKERFPNEQTRPKNHNEMSKENMAGYGILAPFEGSRYPGIVMWNDPRTGKVDVLFEDVDYILGIDFKDCTRVPKKDEYRIGAVSNSNYSLFRRNDYINIYGNMSRLEILLAVYSDYSDAQKDETEVFDFETPLAETEEIIRHHLWTWTGGRTWLRENKSFFRIKSIIPPKFGYRETVFNQYINSNEDLPQKKILLETSHCKALKLQIVRENRAKAVGKPKQVTPKKKKKKKPVQKKKKQMPRKQRSPPQLSIENIKLDTLLPSLSEQLENLLSSVRNSTEEENMDEASPTTTNNLQTLSFENELDGFSLQSELDTAGSSLAEVLTNSYVEASNNSSSCSITGEIQINKTENGMRIITSERSTSQQKPKSHDRNDIDIDSLISNIKQELEAEASRYIKKCVSISSNDTVNDTSIDMEESSEEEEPEEEEYDEVSEEEEIEEVEQKVEERFEPRMWNNDDRSYEDFDLKPGQAIAIIYVVPPTVRKRTQKPKKPTQSKKRAAPVKRRTSGSAPLKRSKISDDDNADESDDDYDEESSDEDEVEVIEVKQLPPGEYIEWDGPHQEAVILSFNEENDDYRVLIDEKKFDPITGNIFFEKSEATALKTFKVKIDDGDEIKYRGDIGRIIEEGCQLFSPIILSKTPPNSTESTFRGKVLIIVGIYDIGDDKAKIVAQSFAPNNDANIIVFEDRKRGFAYKKATFDDFIDDDTIPPVMKEGLNEDNWESKILANFQPHEPIPQIKSFVCFDNNNVNYMVGKLFNQTFYEEAKAINEKKEFDGEARLRELLNEMLNQTTKSYKKLKSAIEGRALAIKEEIVKEAMAKLSQPGLVDKKYIKKLKNKLSIFKQRVTFRRSYEVYTERIEKICYYLDMPIPMLKEYPDKIWESFKRIDLNDKVDNFFKNKLYCAEYF